MADDRHEDASQEGSSQKHSPATDIETTEKPKTADHAGSGFAGGAADDKRDDASQEGSWQSHPSATDPDANGISGVTGDTGSGHVGGTADDHQPVGEQAVSPPPRSRALSAVIAAITGAI